MSGRPDLVYYPDSAPGITRTRHGRGFSYRAPDGTRIDCKRARSRIEALAVPPAYEDVWISPRSNGHLQATGRDARQRKQYRYHPDWTAFRAERKFDHLAEFGDALPRIRDRVLRGLRKEPGQRDFALAAVLALLDRASMRVGNPVYTRENGSYGATTLEPRHVALDGDGILLRFTAKGGRKVRTALRDVTLNRMFEQLDDLPGRTLVAWLDDAGTPHHVSSDAVNAWLADVTGNDRVTAKTFRTWNGTAAALEAALQPGKLTVKAMAEAAAERLHNTPAIARTSYIHPRVMDLAGQPEEERRAGFETAGMRRGLRRTEALLVHFLRQR